MTSLADRIRDGDPTALDELDALHEGSPQGPWRFVAPRPTCSGGIWSGPAGGANILVTPNADEQDLALIVALRNAYPALVARVRALERTAGGLAIAEGLADEERDAWRIRAECAEAALRSLITDGKLDDPDEIKRRIESMWAAVAERDA